MSDDIILNAAAIAELEHLSKWPFVEFDFTKELKLIAEEYAHEEEHKMKQKKRTHPLSYV